MLSPIRSTDNRNVGFIEKIYIRVMIIQSSACMYSRYTSGVVCLGDGFELLLLESLMPPSFLAYGMLSWPKPPLSYLTSAAFFPSKSESVSIACNSRTLMMYTLYF